MVEGKIGSYVRCLHFTVNMIGNTWKVWVEKWLDPIGVLRILFWLVGIEYREEGVKVGKSVNYHVQ